jgi:hypothetical protein
VAFGFPCRIFFKLSLLDIRKALNCAYWKLIIHSPNGAIQFSWLFTLILLLLLLSISLSLSSLPIHFLISILSPSSNPSLSLTSILHNSSCNLCFLLLYFLLQLDCCLTNFAVTTFMASTYQADLCFQRIMRTDYPKCYSLLHYLRTTIDHLSLSLPSPLRLISSTPLAAVFTGVIYPAT